MARKAGPPRGATEPGQPPAAGQEPAFGDVSGDAPAPDSVPASEVQADENLVLTSPDSGPSGLDAAPRGAEAGPSYGEPLVTGPSAPGETSILSGELAGDPGRTDAADPGDQAGPGPLTAPGPAVDGSERDEAPEATVAPSSSAYEYASPPAAEPPPRRNGIGALLLGGALAAGLGFGAAYLAEDLFGASQVQAPADLEERLAALESRPETGPEAVEELATRLAEIETRVAELEAVPAPEAAPAEAVDLGPLREEVEQGTAETRSLLAALEERLTALEARPAASAEEAPLGSLAADPGPAVRTAPAGEAPPAEVSRDVEPRLAQLETGLSSLQDDLASNRDAVETTSVGLEEVRTGLGSLDARLGQVETSVGALDTRLGQAEATSAAAAEQARAAEAALAETEARSAAAEAQARAGAALAQLDAALDEGQPFEGILADLQATGMTVPGALAASAATGVPSLAALRESFPEAARAALAEARAQGLLDEGGGLTGFLSSQLSLRSTAPREGSDADAVLSQAEAALAQGRLDDALTQIETLPQPVRDAMGDWISQAQTRDGAVGALAALRGPEPDPAPAD